MSSYIENESHWSDPFVGRFLRFAAGGTVPASWFQASLPSLDERSAKTGALTIEVVSHCWKYAHLLNYQLSSLVKFPPTECSVIMTVYYAREDDNTSALLDYFGAMDIQNVTWNWCELPPNKLFRRAIGRNDAAKKSKADWVWFTDCDLMFRDGCLDTLNQLLQGRKDALVFPRQERITALLAEEDPMLAFDKTNIEPADIDASQFSISERGRATGPLQITHGDVARAAGYCEALTYYQRPSAKWCKAYEDRAFRWLLRSQGVPLDIPSVYRIRHVFKGRYTGSKVNSGMRKTLRKFTSWVTEKRRDSAATKESSSKSGEA